MLLNVVVVGFVAIMVFAIGVMIYVWLHRSRDALTRRALKSTRRVDIGTVADGATVKIAGRVSCVGRAPLKAPASGRPCVCWEIVVEEEQPTTEATTWQEIVRDEEAQPFMLDDGTGRALVEARYPQLSLKKDGRYRSIAFDGAAPRLREFLESRGKPSVTVFGQSKGMRFLEGVIEAGETVSVFGQVRLEPDPDGGGGDGGYRKAATRVVIEATGDGAILISDDESTAR
jgi:hypothetical protein